MSDNFDNENKKVKSNNEEYQYSPKSVIDVPVTDDAQKKSYFEIPESGNKKKKKPFNLMSFLTWVLVILFIVLGVLLSKICYTSITSKDDWFGLFGTNSSINSTNESHPHSVINIKSTDSNDPSSLSAETIYEKVAPCVVGIVVYNSATDLISSPVGQGSGVIVSSDGYIVTNSHVIGDSKNHPIKVVLNTKEEFTAKIIGFDTKTDLGVIKIDKQGLTAAEFGNSDEARVGSWVVALGNPLGIEFDFECSITQGIISAINRPTSSISKNFVKYIQTDAAINPGNSGGPLVDKHGRVIGITSSKINLEHFEGMGFAIPSNLVKEITDDLIGQGYVSTRVRLGISAQMVDSTVAQMNGVPTGIVIAKISDDSDLNNVGAQVGDIITKINNIKILKSEDFYNELFKHKPGETIILELYRRSVRIGIQGETFSKTVKLLEDKGETQENTR